MAANVQLPVARLVELQEYEVVSIHDNGYIALYNIP